MVRMQTNRVIRQKQYPEHGHVPGVLLYGVELLAYSIENALAVVLDTFFVFAQVFQRSGHVVLVTAHGVCELVDGIEGQIADCVMMRTCR